MTDTNPVVKIVMPTFREQLKGQTAALGASLAVIGGIGLVFVAAGYVAGKLANKEIAGFETRHPE